MSPNRALESPHLHTDPSDAAHTDDQMVFQHGLIASSRGHHG